MAKNTYTKFLLLVLCVTALFNRGRACSPLNVPGVSVMTVTSNSLVITVTNTSQWLNCPNVIDIEFACLNSNFSGFASDTYTTAPQSFPSSPYAYPTQSVYIGNLCAGTVYKIRIRERNNNLTTASQWSSSFTFTTGGVYVPPQLTLSSNPNIICPPAPVQLNAFMTNTCGRSGVFYSWSPATGLNNPTIANPVASINAPTTYTCFVSGGATGCWAVVATMFINIGTGPPVPGIASVTPSVLCVYNSATLNTTTYTGNIQWQSSTSSNGPWTNIPGATSSSLAIASVSATTCYQGLLTSCSGATAVTNVVCANTNNVPTMTVGPACSGTTSQLSFSYTGTSGTPTAVVWAPPPLSVNANSTVANYNTNGTYYAIAQFSDGCISSQSVNLVIPTASVNTSSVSCSVLGSATVFPSNIPGPYSLQWQPVSQTFSIANSLFPGTHTCYINYNNNTCVLPVTATLVSNSQITGTVSSSAGLVCPNVPTASASIVVSGGSGLTSYTWNTTNTGITPSITGLGAGTHTVFVTDLMTYCSLTQTFLVNNVPDFTLNVTGATTACVNSNITLTAQNTGGTGPYTYTWNAGAAGAAHNVSETNPGVHVYTIVSQDVNGCSVIRNYSVTFIALPVVTVANINICPGSVGTLTAQGASTYTWNNSGSNTGPTFTANPAVNTTYFVTGTSQGCQGNASGSMLMLPVPSPTFTSNSPICNGQNLNLNGNGGQSYQWSGPLAFSASGQNTGIFNATPARSGIYTLVVTGINTCTASTTASLTVNATPVLTAAGSTVCSTGSISLSATTPGNATYVWNGPLNYFSSIQNPTIVNPSVQRSGNYTVTVLSSDNCSNTAVVNVTVTQLPVVQITSDSPKCTGSVANLFGSGGLSYQWVGPNAFNSNNQNVAINNIPVAGSGVYTLYVTTGPCIAYATHNYAVFPLPVITASNGGAVCETKTISLFAIPATPVVNYAWNGPGFVSAQPNPVRYPASLMQTGDYTLTVTDINGCRASATTSVTVLNNPNVAAAGATVCTFAKMVMAANGANSYTWTGPGNFYMVSANAIINSVTNSNTGVYYVLGQAANGCTNVSTATLGILPLPVPTLNVAPSNTICINGTVALSGAGGIKYNWKGPDDIFSNEQTVVIQMNKLDFAGIYTLVVADANGCSSSASTRLFIYPNPEGSLDGELSGCAPLCGKYKFIDGGSGHKVNTTWKIGLTNLPSSFSYCFDAPGTYTVTGFFTDSVTTCSTAKKYFVNVNEKPEASFTLDPSSPVEKIDEVHFYNNSTGNGLSKFTWYVVGYTGDPTIYYEASPVKSFDEPGNYAVILTAENEHGCMDTAFTKLEVQPDFLVFVPDAFTPNGDRINEKFTAVTRGIRLFEMSIYNRWGILVYKTDNPNDGWDGTFEGKTCKTDIYTWRISATGKHGEHRELNGHVTLYR